MLPDQSLLNKKMNKNKIENLILLDYYENHPLGIIYDWIRSNSPSNTLIILDLGYIPYCKTGSYKLINDSFHKILLKKIRMKFLIVFLKLKGYKIIDFDEKLFKKYLKKKSHLSLLPKEIKKEILRDFVCHKDKQFSFLDLRVNYINESFNKSINNTYNNYENVFKEIIYKNNIKKAYIFNGRSLRQKVVSYLLKKYLIEVKYIERNMWNIGRTICSRDRIHSFKYLLEDKCKDYGISKHDISIDELFKNVIGKDWGNMHTEKFNLLKNNRKTISYLAGSSDEYLAFTEEIMLKDCNSQLEIVMHISEICFKNNLNFILRVHPNTRNKNKLDIDLWNDVCEYLISRNQLFYSSSSNINTYSIIDFSDLIITNGSTVTVESCLRGKDVCLCGFNGLRNYNSTFIPKNLKELEAFIKNKKDKNLDITINEAKKYILDELEAGRILKFYSMAERRFNFQNHRL